MDALILVLTLGLIFVYITETSWGGIGEYSHIDIGDSEYLPKISFAWSKGTMPFLGITLSLMGVSVVLSTYRLQCNADFWWWVDTKASVDENSVTLFQLGFGARRSFGISINTTRGK